MSEQPILTAIIFTYNHKNHITRCIESLLNQNTTYHYEIRIYDDCSTDGTTEICREYAEKYPDKIKLTVQTENTFLKPYNEMQSYKAIQEIDTKYFCIIDGDDCWCDENKVQIALDCLENHPEYIGFAHDTNHINLLLHKEESYVHELLKLNDFENPVVKKAVPYFLTSSRIFRNCGFKDKHIIPVDYLIYFYHAAKGPIYYYDKIMANYYISEYNNYSNIEPKEQQFLLTTFGYKVAKFFDYKEDELAMDVQAYYNKRSLKALKLYKKLFGVKWGWNIWYFITFVPAFGLESFDLNWVCPRKLVKKKADNRSIEIKHLIKYNKRVLYKKTKICKILEIILNMNIIKKSGLYNYLSASYERKQNRIKSLKKDIIHLEHTLKNIKED